MGQDLTYPGQVLPHRPCGRSFRTPPGPESSRPVPSRRSSRSSCPCTCPEPAARPDELLGGGQEEGYGVLGSGNRRTLGDIARCDPAAGGCFEIDRVVADAGAEHTQQVGGPIEEGVFVIEPGGDCGLGGRDSGQVGRRPVPGPACRRTGARTASVPASPYARTRSGNPSLCSSPRRQSPRRQKRRGYRTASIQAPACPRTGDRASEGVSATSTGVGIPPPG